MLPRQFAEADWLLRIPERFDACEMLLSIEVVAANLTVQENQVIQHYLAALVEKFPTRLK